MRTNLSQHILPNSSMMLGVCMTVISVIKVVGVHHGGNRIAEAFALDSVLFLVSAMLSYASIRAEALAELSIKLEKFADASFLLGLLFMTSAGFVLAYEIF